MSSRTLVITNDFPPSIGGIESFVYGLVSRQPAESVVVLTSGSSEAREFDQAQDFEVVRYPSAMLLPEPRVRNLALELVRSHDCDRVLFGAAAPLGLLAGHFGPDQVERSIAITHGHEAGWAALPGARRLLRKVGDNTDVMTYLGDYTRRKIGRVLSPAARARMRRLVPGIDTERFHPRNVTTGLLVREQLGLGSRPVIVCVSRLMPRKGQDTLIQALPLVQQRIPNAALLLVGDGRQRAKLEGMIRNEGLGGDVFLQNHVSDQELPGYLAAGDVFAMPCRTRHRGLDVEGLGIAYLEASASGLPVVTGDSGGASSAVIDGETGYSVSGNSVYPLADALITLLGDRELSMRLGRAGRKWVESEWSWANATERLNLLLEGNDPDDAHLAQSKAS